MRIDNHTARKALRLLSILAIASVAVGVIVWWAGRPTVHSVEREIKAELPSGSSKLEVISFLDARHIKHSEMLVGGKYEARYKPDGRRVEKRFITGLIHNRYGPLPAEERIAIIFYFDDDDSLIDYDIRSHEIAP